MNAALRELMETLEAAATRKSFRQIDFFEPYDKQREFFDLGLIKRERLLRAGNQLGKTYAGAAEVSYHMTGQYPDWWLGRRYAQATTGWVAGETSTLVRDGPQRLLCGKPGVTELFGTGLVPRESFVGKPSLARGVTDAYDTIQVRHVSGGISTATFKSYEQGRTKFQSGTIDWGWGDEEPPSDIYGEFIARITATRGMLFITFTPLKGMSEVVARFLNEPSPDRADVNMVIEDAKHIPAEERAKIIAGYPAHERDARVRGAPMLGSGRIFQVSQEAITEAPIDYIPPHWYKLWAVDFGIDHPFAAVLALWDKDADVIHIHHTLRVKDQMALQHAAAMKPIGAAVPVAWPQDGTARDKGSGETLASQYKKHGLLMLPDHATWEDGGVSTEAGITEMAERMVTGRWKVAAHLSDWFEEFRLYHRKDGLIVKERDDLMSASRVVAMMKRFARQVPLGDKRIRSRGSLMAKDIDFDLFG